MTPQEGTSLPVRSMEVALALAAAGIQGEVRELTESTRTAAEVAAALGCDVGAIANSLVSSPRIGDFGGNRPPPGRQHRRTPLGPRPERGSGRAVPALEQLARAYN